MEVLYHITPYFCWDIPLHRPYIGLICGRYLQFRILKIPLIREVPWDLLILEAELASVAEERQESDKSLKDPLSDAGKLRADWNDME